MRERIEFTKNRIYSIMGTLSFDVEEHETSRIYIKCSKSRKYIRMINKIIKSNNYPFFIKLRDGHRLCMPSSIVSISSKSRKRIEICIMGSLYKIQV